jgi:hypothetical protein
MALSDNPYIGIPVADLLARQTLLFQAEGDVLKTGKSNAFPGWSITRADMPEIRNSLSLIRIAIGYANGTIKQSAQAIIRTDHQFSGRIG